MIQGSHTLSLEPLVEFLHRPGGHMRSHSTSQFSELFGTASTPEEPDAQPAAKPGADSTEPTVLQPALRGPVDTPAGLGAPNVQMWLNGFYDQQKAGSSTGTIGITTADTDYQPAAGAALSALDQGMYGPDAIFTQALANQAGNSFAGMTGEDPVNFTAQLPGVPSLQVQQGFDQQLAYSNAQRLLAGEPIDTAAYWSDPGSMTLHGQTFTSQQLGYAGPGKSSGPEPIWISDANQRGPDTFCVPGYTGTVSGIKAGHFYTLEQLEQAGLKTGQPEGRFVPGSWSSVQPA